MGECCCGESYNAVGLKYVARTQGIKITSFYESQTAKSIKEYPPIQHPWQTVKLGTAREVSVARWTNTIAFDCKVKTSTSAPTYPARVNFMESCEVKNP